MKQFEILLQRRMVPFAQHRGYSLIRNFEDLDAVTKFVESWRNLNPHRNKKVDGPLPLRPLANSIKRADLERFRAFLRYCEERAWLTTNQAKKIRFKSKVEKKFGFEPEEERVFRAIDLVDDGRGRTGQYKAQELRVFCLGPEPIISPVPVTLELKVSELLLDKLGNGYVDPLKPDYVQKLLRV